VRRCRISWISGPWIIGLFLLPLGGCGGIQSVLEPYGTNADAIATLSWVMFIGAAAIFVVVMALTAYAVLASQRRRATLRNRALIIGGGIVFPVVTLSALLVYGLVLAGDLTGSGNDDPPLRIEVVGEQWWWPVLYPGADGRPDVATANEIRIPAGRTVEFVLTTADVIHSFWVPNLAGKLDMIPGHVNTLRVTATEPGEFRGQCAEYCGGPHALMAFFVIAMPPDEFDRWFERESQPVAEPPNPFLQRGRDLFLSHGCGGCHAVRGTPADGIIGPDLTHIGSRVSLAAGILPNNQGTLAGWIADTQTVKPNNLMPSFNIFAGEDLRAVAAWLESLK
jgi:cytochrome c oxidase subunit 2